MTVFTAVQFFYFAFIILHRKVRVLLTPVGRHIQTLCFISTTAIHSDYPLNPIICCWRSSGFALILISPRFTQFPCQNIIEELTETHICALFFAFNVTQWAKKYSLPVDCILAGVGQGIFRCYCDITWAWVLGPCCHNRMHLLTANTAVRYSEYALKLSLFITFGIYFSPPINLRQNLTSLSVTIFQAWTHS